jgi:hypothetical protein
MTPHFLTAPILEIAAPHAMDIPGTPELKYGQLGSILSKICIINFFW